jgi:arsenical pump membrane protein
MIAAAAGGWNVGLVTLGLAVAATAGISCFDGRAARSIVAALPWQILPLVAGLFVVIDAFDRAGGLSAARFLLARATGLAPPLASLACAITSAAVSGALNNLPVAMAVAYARNAVPSAQVLHAAAIGIDLGPNLCVTGSLSTLLWLIAIRREGLDVSGAAFFRIGLRAGLPALAVAALLVR